MWCASNSPLLNSCCTFQSECWICPKLSLNVSWVLIGSSYSMTSLLVTAKTLINLTSVTSVILWHFLSLLIIFHDAFLMLDHFHCRLQWPPWWHSCIWANQNKHGAWQMWPSSCSSKINEHDTVLFMQLLNVLGDHSCSVQARANSMLCDDKCQAKGKSGRIPCCSSS